MKKIDIKEFKERSYIEIIQELMKINNGYITSRLITDLGIHRMYLKLMEERNIIKKVESGIYVDSKKKETDDYFVYSLKNPKVIFSHLTALYLYGVYSKENQTYDITVPHKYHNTNNNIHNVHYITNEYYNIGITEVKTSKGNKVKTYDVSKSICDIIRFKADENIIKKCMKEYIKKYNKYDDLLYFAELLNVKDKVIEYYEKIKSDKQWQQVTMYLNRKILKRHLNKSVIFKTYFRQIYGIKRKEILWKKRKTMLMSIITKI